MYDTEEFIIAVYCCVDDCLRKITQGKRIRARGFAPSLSDSEVLTMEIVGEFQGLDCDRASLEIFLRPLAEIISIDENSFNICQTSCQFMEL